MKFTITVLTILLAFALIEAMPVAQQDAATKKPDAVNKPPVNIKPTTKPDGENKLPVNITPTKKPDGENKPPVNIKPKQYELYPEETAEEIDPEFTLNEDVDDNVSKRHTDFQLKKTSSSSEDDNDDFTKITTK